MKKQTLILIIGMILLVGLVTADLTGVIPDLPEKDKPTLSSAQIEDIGGGYEIYIVSDVLHILKTYDGQTIPCNRTRTFDRDKNQTIYSVELKEMYQNCIDNKDVQKEPKLPDYDVNMEVAIK